MDDHIGTWPVRACVSILSGVPSVFPALQPSSDVYCVPSTLASIVCVCVESARAFRLVVCGWLCSQQVRCLVILAVCGPGLVLRASMRGMRRVELKMVCQEGWVRMDIVEAEMSGGTQKTDAGGRDVNYYFSLSLFLLAGFGKVNESIFFTK